VSLLKKPRSMTFSVRSEPDGRRDIFWQLDKYPCRNLYSTSFSVRLEPGGPLRDILLPMGNWQLNEYPCYNFIRSGGPHSLSRSRALAVSIVRMYVLNALMPTIGPTMTSVRLTDCRRTSVEGISVFQKYSRYRSLISNLPP